MTQANNVIMIVGRVGADPVPLNPDVVDLRTVEINACRGVPRDDIPGIRGRAADQRRGSAVEQDADRIAQRCPAGGVGSDHVIRDEVVFT